MVRGAVVDGDAAGALVDLVILDAEEAHEFLLDELYEVGLVDDEGVAEAEPAGQGGAQLPGADDLAEPERAEAGLGLGEAAVQIGGENGGYVGLDVATKDGGEFRGGVLAVGGRASA